MKRSEMLNLIHDLLERQSWTGCSYRFKALEILECVEKAGMVPPETIRYVDQDNGNTSCIPECAWEAEDE